MNFREYFAEHVANLMFFIALMVALGLFFWPACAYIANLPHGPSGLVFYSHVFLLICFILFLPLSIYVLDIARTALLKSLKRSLKGQDGDL